LWERMESRTVKKEEKAEHINRSRRVKERRNRG
jgi:hypothetical protein